MKHKECSLLKAVISVLSCVKSLDVTNVQLNSYFAAKLNIYYIRFQRSISDSSTLLF